MSLASRVGTLWRSAPEPLRGAPAAITALLLLALCVYTSFVLRNARDTMRGTEGSPAPLRPAASSSADTLLSRLLAANLFGKRPESIDAVTRTAEGLVLTGVISTSEPENGFAIIGETADKGRLFRVGETQNGVRLVAVYFSRVLLERGGVMESLELPKLGGNGTAAVVMASVSTPDRPGIPPDSAVFGAIINAHLNIEGEKQTGYVIYPGEDHESFNRLGLQGGDVIVAVNGRRLDDPESSPNVLADLSVLPQAAITVRRGRRERNIDLDLANGLAEAAVRRAETESAPPPEEHNRS